MCNVDVCVGVTGRCIGTLKCVMWMCVFVLQVAALEH